VRIAVQSKGPSPMLPAWLDFWMQPSRAAWQRGLKAGMSPLLLPPQERGLPGRRAGNGAGASGLEDGSQARCSPLSFTSCSD
jgi:hypothetical protein